MAAGEGVGGGVAMGVSMRWWACLGPCVSSMLWFRRGSVSIARLQRMVGAEDEDLRAVLG